MEKKTIGLTDDQIIEGLRRRDSRITRDYFYGYCRIAWHIYDRQYALALKPGMDFYSIAHEYYLALDKHGFKQLEDRNPGCSLKTWMINGFRFVLLDRLKGYQREHRIDSFEDRLEKANVKFDIPDNNFQEDFRNTVFEICRSYYGRDSRASIILQMLLIDGFKGKEIATQLGISPSAVAQRFHKMMNEIVIPYFKRYYEAPMESACLEVEQSVKAMHLPMAGTLSYLQNTMQPNYSNRITPEYIIHLQPNEIFVFGSNLAGMHGGGAARTARLHFGAVMGNGDGPQGQSYAIPTMQGGVETIKPYVDKFIAYAKSHSDQTFLVTPIGCGIAGFFPEDIAPLFEDAIDVENIYLPKSFWEILK